MAAYLLSQLVQARISIIVLLACSFNVVWSGENEKLREAMMNSARAQGIDPDNLKPGQMLMTPPDMSDEEEGSQFMPKIHRCDGCRAVAYQLEKNAFPSAERKKKKGQKLGDSEILDVTENLCNNGFHRQYGLKNVKGKNVLSGEGLESADEPGMMEAGGRWQARLQNLCKELIEEYEEDGIYEMYTERGEHKLELPLCSSYCKGADRKKLQDEL
ncbi:marginal zone B- and B1-cell-specific protein [Aplysia californica]|uniref:Marginal zone B- and B1-cell-specific protein n=1 Tax=Aplysia californica TaxID=6500 RepID=A0ABM0JRK4_APLCA|nr:marginal zone B- and B1-cell-specific protein [Aplysia californica]